MAYTIDLRKENGELIERETRDAFDLARALPDFDDAEYPYLRLIDPYGHTWFSSHQMAAVIPELQRLAGEKRLPALDRLLEMARRCRDTIGSFLVFLGD